MGQSAVVWDCEAAYDMKQDSNGVNQVVLRSPNGASAKVKTFFYNLFVYSVFMSYDLIFYFLFYFLVDDID